MRWVLVVKAPNLTVQSLGTSLKDTLAMEASHQCVYCAITEMAFGGIRNFHVDHFRPKRHFPQLIDVYGNLFFSCAICNTFKSDTWPGDPTADLSTATFVDPSQTDYNLIFAIAEARGTLEARCAAAAFILERLYLNRQQLVTERRLARVRARLRLLAAEAKALQEQPLANAAPSVQAFRRIVAALASIVEALTETTVPYGTGDVSRPVGHP